MDGAKKGYKVFEHDWTCKGFQYTCPGTFEDDVIPSVCDCGFHFCEKAVDCFRYYDFDPRNKVAEVIALGDVDSDGTKSCTNKIQIIREIPWAELLEIVNIGKQCSGYCNSGNRNSGNRNSGDWNSGNRNSGNRNSGHWNSGHWNSGDWNSGDWNKTSFSSGCFCTAEPKILLFNKPSEWTFRDWRDSAACYILHNIPVTDRILEYVYFDYMSDREKAEHPEAEITGGYLKILNNYEYAQDWWRGLSDENKSIVMSIPNFDKAIFREITGIDVDAE